MIDFIDMFQNVMRLRIVYIAGFRATKYFIPGVNWNSRMKKMVNRGTVTTKP